MGYEIDFLAVGDGARSGDAIALRYGNLFGHRWEQTVVIIDGGFADDGKALVDHIRTYYSTDIVDVVISTHPDCDHINGLPVVLEELDVGELWIHQPRVDEMALALEALRATSTVRKQRLSRLTASLSATEDLLSIAKRRGIPVREPFAGLSTADGALFVAGPTEAYYDELVRGFRSYTRSEGFVAKAAEALRTLFESLHHETLGEDSDTSPENNSSVVSVLALDGVSCIFTGDAGVDALHRAADYLDALGFDWSTVKFIDVPHHGSRRNVTPSVLDRFLGPKVQTAITKTAFVSCAPEGRPKHPAKKVTNAFIRRGTAVFETAGSAKRHHHDAPARSWGPAIPLPFFNQVDE